MQQVLVLALAMASWWVSVVEGGSEMAEWVREREAREDGGLVAAAGTVHCVP